MIVACFLISIFTGLVAAIYALSGGFGVIVAVAAYSLSGAFALVLSMSIAAAVAQARGSRSASDLPPS